MRLFLVVVLIACGGGSTESPLTNGDAGVDAADAAVDAPPDAFVGPITVEAYDQFGAQPHLPLAGAMVRFIAPDGSYQTATTNALGIATVSAQQNTTVLLFQEGELDYPLVKTFVGANPGDHIKIGKHSRQAFLDIGDVTFQLPVVAGASQYRLSVSCSRRIAAASDTEVTMRATDCAVHQAATAVAYAENSAGTTITGASVLTGLNLATLVGTTVAMPAYGTQTMLGGSMVNVPANATEAAWSAFYYKTNDRMLVAAGGSTAATANVPVLDVGDRTVSTLTFRLPGYERIAYYENHASKLHTVALDGANMIRPYANATYDAATKSVTWDEPAVGQPATMVTFRITVRNASFNTKMFLYIHAPYTAARTVALPPLPAELAIAPNDMVGVNVTRFYTLVGKTYSDVLEIIDTGEIVEHDPSFTGKLWLVR